MDKAELILLLKKSTLFSGLTAEQLDNILPYFSVLDLKKDQTLFHQGDAADELFVLASGKLVSVLQMSNAQSKVIGNIYPAETVGELGVISGEPRSLTIKALDDCMLLRLSAENFLALMQTIPAIAIDLLKLITHRSQKTLALFSAIDKARLIMIFSANSAVSVDKFKEKLLQHSKDKDCQISTISKNNSSVLTTVKKNLLKEKTTQIVFVEELSSPLFSFLEDNDAHLYLLVNGEDEPVLDDAIKQLINQTRNIPHILSWKMIILHNENIRRPFATKKWLDQVKVDLHHHVGISKTEHYLRLLRFLSGRAVGLVLSSGALRGFIHLGVMKAMIRKRIPIDYICGTSIGGAIAGVYAFNAGSFKRTFKMCWQAAPTIRSSVLLKQFIWPLVSLFSDRSLTKLSMEMFGDVNIEDLWLPYFCVSSNLSMNVEKIHNSGPLWQAVRCTTSIPGIYPPVEIAGQLYCDGALLNDIPADIMRKTLGNDGKIIVSMVSASSANPKPYLIPLFLSFTDTLLYKIGIGRKKVRFPPFFDTFFHALLLGSATKSIQNSFFADIVIRPNVQNLPTFGISDQQLQKLIAYGYDETIKTLANNSESLSDFSEADVKDLPSPEGRIGDN